jgi:hypothetical protein
MTATIQPSRSTRFIKPVCLAIFAVSLAFAARGLFSGYSYWLDELFSVTASRDGWRRLFGIMLQADVHPPLYQIVLKVWILLFGSSEVATRILSFLFSSLALSAFSLDAIIGKRWRRVATLLFIGASPFFAFYSQETRSYAMVLALSSVITLSFLELRSRDRAGGTASETILSCIYYAGSLLLSLTHYFGWIYVFVLSLVGFFEKRIEHVRLRTIFLFAAMSIWPLCHVFFGGLMAKSGGNFWIKVSPPIFGTITILLKGVMPFMAGAKLPYLLIISLLLIGAFVFLSAGQWRQSVVADECRLSLLVVLLFVALLALVDLRTPMSTPRNYIVLLPLVMIGLANSFVMLANVGGIRSPSWLASLFLVGLVTLFLAKHSWSQLGEKIQPHQNWKSLAAYVNESKVCSDGCLVVGSFGLHTYYFSGIGAGLLKEVSSDQLDSVQMLPGVRILGFHQAYEELAELMNANKERVCLQGTQSKKNSTFIVLPKSALTGREADLGMKSCALP